MSTSDRRCTAAAILRTTRVRTRGALSRLLLAAGWLACSGAVAPVPGPESQRPVADPQAFYTLVAPEADWKRDPATAGADAPDLSLSRRDGSAALIVFASTGTNLRLEDFVAARRNRVLDGDLREVRERRYFLDDEGQVPASMARYVHRSQVYLVLTALDGSRLVEAIGVCMLNGGREAEVADLLGTVRFVAEPQ